MIDSAVHHCETDLPLLPSWPMACMVLVMVEYYAHGRFASMARRGIAQRLVVPTADHA